MTDNSDIKSPAQALAEAVARRKAAQGSGGRNYPGARTTERAAAHHASSQSKPASRK